MNKPATLIASLAAAIPMVAGNYYPCEITGDKTVAEGIIALNINGETIGVSSTSKYTYIYNSPIVVPTGTTQVAISAIYRGASGRMRLYFDYDQDGFFNDEDEIVTTVNTGSSMTLDIPSGTAAGAYRGRVQVGSDYAVDFVLHIAPLTGTLEAKALNGIILSSNADNLASTISRNTALKVQALPTLEGYEASSIIVRHGFNVTDKNYKCNNLQWIDTSYSLASDGTVTIPGSEIYGDVEIYAIFNERDDSQWTKVWSDEFSDDQLDADRWGYQSRGSSTWNRIIATTETGLATVNKFDGTSYKSYASPIKNALWQAEMTTMITGAINSSKKFSFTYGKVEARIRTRAHSGNFPAFWMMPQNGTLGWPKDGEIDIWETINTENITYGTLHSGWTNQSFGSPAQYSPEKGGTKYTDVSQWHVYAVEWNSESINWYVDGTKYFTYSNQHYSDGANYTESITWPFDKPFYIILNQSVGDGSWASSPDEKFEYCTEFDYVRVYQKKNDKSYTFTSTATKANNDDNFYVPGSEIPDNDAGVADITVDNSNAPTQYYNLNGQLMTSSSLTPGLYIKRVGNKASKVIVK